MSIHILQGDLTIYNAIEQKAELLNYLACSEELEINLSQVNDIDTSGLQLLILLKREAVKHAKKLSYIMHSKAVLEILEMTRLTSVFGDQVILAHDEE